MALDIPELIRGVVKTVERVAGSLRDDILHTPIAGRTATGPTYGAPVPRKAFVEFVGESVTSLDGTEHLSSAKFSFFEPVAIQERERLTLDGVVMNIVKVDGAIDPSTHKPYNPTVWTGK